METAALGNSGREVAVRAASVCAQSMVPGGELPGYSEIL
jgi:hypothetical protein